MTIAQAAIQPLPCDGCGQLASSEHIARRLRRLELTDIMQLGRGILIGRLPSSAAQVAIDGSSAAPKDRATWVRIVLPVLQSERGPDKTIPKASERSEPLPKSGNTP